VGNREKPLGSLNEGQGINAILANLGQMPLQFLCFLLAIVGQEMAILNEGF